MQSNITPLYFISSNIIHFGQKQPIKVHIFEISECSGQNLLNSLCQFWTGKSIPVQILHHSTHNFPVSFKLIHFLFCIKGTNKSSNFETFVCFDKSLPNSWCHFPNHKSVFHQFFDDSLVSWNITRLYFFRLNVICFAQKGRMKEQSF